MTLSDYDTIKFKDDIKQTITGYRVGKWLAVVKRQGSGYRIYRIDVGVPVIQSIFASINDAIRFAEWLVDKFGQFFDIWESYPDIDLFGIVKWTVEDGLRLFETIKELDKNSHKIETLAAVNDAYDKVEDNAKQWNGRFRSN